MTMDFKKLVFLFCLAIGFTHNTNAQRVMLVDSDFIMENMPEFKEAQEELNKLSAQWQKEVERRYQEINDLKAAYQAELVLLTDEMRGNRKKIIADKEAAVTNFQQEKFGLEGELFNKRQTLVQPLQERLYEAIKEVAEAGNYDVVMDKTTQSSILYSDPKLDKSLTVLRKMGVKVASN